MSPDDKRHGTTRGYHAGCREACCRRAIAAYEKVTKYRRAKGIKWAIPAIGVQRRIQALMALGWDAVAIAEDAGFGNRNQVWMILKGQKGRPCTWVERKTWVAVCESYERLSMKLPNPQTTGRKVAVTRARNMAQRNGWAPPLAWDNVDDPNERPVTAPKTRDRDIDPAVIERIFAGDHTIRATPAEKAEVCRRWDLSGRSLGDLEEMTGWNVARYYQKGDAA